MTTFPEGAFVTLERRDVVPAELVDASVASIRVEEQELALRLLAAEEHAAELERRLLASERADALAHGRMEELVESRRAEMRQARQVAERTASLLIAEARAEAEAILSEATNRNARSVADPVQSGDHPASARRPPGGPPSPMRRSEP